MKRILVAEDEDVLRMLIVDTLTDEGYDIVEASDGVEAFETYQKQKFDLLLLDYMMPGMTGIDVIKKVRGASVNNQVKIMILTAKTQQQDEEIAKEAGADFFLTKPFSTVKLIQYVEDILDEKN